MKDRYITVTTEYNFVRGAWYAVVTLRDSVRYLDPLCMRIIQYRYGPPEIFRNQTPHSPSPTAAELCQMYKVAEEMRAKLPLDDDVTEKMGRPVYRHGPARIEIEEWGDA